MVQRFITINSRNRVKGTSSNFTCKFQRQYLGPGNHTIRIISASIPLSFYTVDSSNNRLIISGSTYYLNVGKYSGSSLVAELNRIFIEHDETDASSFDISPITGLFSAETSQNETLDEGSTVFNLLGITTPSVILTAGVVYVGNRIVNLAGPSSFYVRLPGMISNSYSDFPDRFNDCITVIEVTQNHLNYEIEKYNPNTSPTLTMQGNVLEEFTILLTDQNNVVVDLQGQETTFSFVIENV